MVHPPRLVPALPRQARRIRFDCSIRQCPLRGHERRFRPVVQHDDQVVAGMPIALENEAVENMRPFSEQAASHSRRASACVWRTMHGICTLSYVQRNRVSEYDS